MITGNTCCSKAHMDTENSNRSWHSSSLLNKCVCAQSFSHTQLFATSRTVARQALLSMEFSSQEYWSGWPFPSPGGLPDPGSPGIESASPALQADSSPLSHQEAPTAHFIIVIIPGQSFFPLCLCPLYKMKKVCPVSLPCPHWS